VSAGFGDRICVFAAFEEDAPADERQQSEQTAQQHLQLLHQQQLQLRRFAAKVAASHRFLRFLAFKSQVSLSVMRQPADFATDAACFAAGSQRFHEVAFAGSKRCQRAKPGAAAAEAAAAAHLQALRCRLCRSQEHGNPLASLFPSTPPLWFFLRFLGEEFRV
jgi:hypothetical protein